MMAGRYRLEEPVGRGGFAVVYRAYDRTLRRQVAVKLLDSARSGDTLGEAQAAAKLSHPNVARVYDYGETTADDGCTRPFLVMEYVAGDTLADRLDRGGALPWPEAADLCAQVASALAAAHAHGLVHRDIKPRNIMLGPTGVKVVDLGVAATAGQRSTDDDGRVWGTPIYLAPEQLRGERCFPPADIFALGLLLHACLTGTAPWSGAGTEEIFAARRMRPVPALPHPDGFPTGLVALHDRCVQPLSRRRPNAGEAAAILRRYATGSEPPRPAATVTLRAAPAPRSRAVLAGAATAGALIAGVLALPWASGGTTEAAAQHALKPNGHPRPTASKSTTAVDGATPRATMTTALTPARTRAPRSGSKNNEQLATTSVAVARATPPAQHPATAPGSASASAGPSSTPTPGSLPPSPDPEPTPSSTSLSPSSPPSPPSTTTIPALNTPPGSTGANPDDHPASPPELSPAWSDTHTNAASTTNSATSPLR